MPGKKTQTENLGLDLPSAALVVTPDSRKTRNRYHFSIEKSERRSLKNLSTLPKLVPSPDLRKEKARSKSILALRTSSIIELETKEI